MTPKDVANRKWNDWKLINGPFDRKSPRKVRFLDFPFQFRDNNYAFTIEKRLAAANWNWRKMFLYEESTKNHRRVWFQEEPFFDEYEK